MSASDFAREWALDPRVGIDRRDARERGLHAYRDGTTLRAFRVDGAHGRVHFAFWCTGNQGTLRVRSGLQTQWYGGADVDVYCPTAEAAVGVCLALADDPYAALRNVACFTYPDEATYLRSLS